MKNRAMLISAMTKFLHSRFPICFALLLATFGCEQKQNRDASDDSATFREQVALVQQGVSREIRSSEPVDDEAFRSLAGLDKLEVLSLENAVLTDVVADTLGELSELRQLRLERAALGDRSAEALRGLAKLTTINLPDSKISPNGIKNWSDLKELIQIRIGSPNLTDEAFETIAKIKSLRFLHLINVPITDAGLPSLHEMKQLESFYIDGGQATDEGLAKLLKNLPGLHFHRDQQHLADDPNADEHGKEK